MNPIEHPKNKKKQARQCFQPNNVRNYLSLNALYMNNPYHFEEEQNHIHDLNQTGMPYKPLEVSYSSPAHYLPHNRVMPDKYPHKRTRQHRPNKHRLERKKPDESHAEKYPCRPN